MTAVHAVLTKHITVALPAVRPWQARAAEGAVTTHIAGKNQLTRRDAAACFWIGSRGMPPDSWAIAPLTILDKKQNPGANGRWCRTDKHALIFPSLPGTLLNFRENSELEAHSSRRGGVRGTGVE